MMVDEFVHLVQNKVAALPYHIFSSNNWPDTILESFKNTCPMKKVNTDYLKWELQYFGSVTLNYSHIEGAGW
jgi:hypothetical protein